MLTQLSHVPKQPSHLERITDTLLAFHVRLEVRAQLEAIVVEQVVDEARELVRVVGTEVAGRDLVERRAKFRHLLVVIAGIVAFPVTIGKTVLN